MLGAGERVAKLDVEAKAYAGAPGSEAMDAPGKDNPLRLPAALGQEVVTRLAQEREIDTILVCMCDMQGRLAGKRLTARHFLQAPNEPVHACDYLLGVDLEMQLVAGLAATGWDRGFG